MFKGANVKVDESKQLPTAPMQMLAGGGIGVASAIFGIGGGSLTVPYLNKNGVVMQKAVATSAACGFTDCNRRGIRLHVLRRARTN